jgi:hypothetical protein
MERQVKLVTILFALIFILPLYCVELQARGVMGAFTKEFYDENRAWYDDVSGFVSIIMQHAGGHSDGFSTYNPYMWRDKLFGGQDYLYADYYEASLILGHAGPVRFEEAYIGFAPNGYVWADEVALGYKTYQGKSIWTFIVQCEILRDVLLDIGSGLYVVIT